MRSLLIPVIAAALWGASASTCVQAGPRHADPLVLAQMDDDQGDGGGAGQGSVAALTVRVDRLEGTIRALTGQIEELQFQNRKLSDDMRKLQQDTDFRFQDLNRGTGTGTGAPPRPAKKSDNDTGPDSTGTLTQDASNGVAPTAPTSTVLVPRGNRRTGDAFDPSSDPNAPGAPRPLGTTPPSAPLTSSGPVTARAADQPPNAPLDLMRRTPADPVSTDAVVPPVDPAPPRPAIPNPTAMASLVPGGTRDEYNGDVDLYKQGQYDSAATGLKSFLDKYPRDRLVPDAVYLLGETYTKLGRHREAAEQYLRLSTDFNKAPRAPDALLRLGMSLNAMGVKEQACATYQEVTRRFPTASPDVRASVDRELKRARC
jgi:tol-pal system protein YbgF